MNLLLTLFGEGKDLNALQMSDRGIVMFFIALALIASPAAVPSVSVHP